MAESVGMGCSLLERFPSAGALLERTEAAWGAPLRRVLLEGPEERLREGDHCQPLLTWYACAVDQALRDRGLRPSAVAGYSLGVFASLVVAGAVSLEGALAVLKFNREVIGREGHWGAMLAVGGLELAAGEEYAADNRAVAVGVVNGPRSWTLTGTPEGIVRAEMDLRPRALQLFRLPSGWAIHSPLLAFAARAAREEGSLWADLRQPEIPFLSPFTGERVETADGAGEVLSQIICRPMRWDRVAAALPSWGGALVEASESGFLGKILKASPARPSVRPAVRLLDDGAA
jgi:[acyl-carrier-protein] S-malonyltransferase